MKIQFTFLGLDCEADGSLANGEFTPETITASGELDFSGLDIRTLDELCASMDKAAANVKVGYVDNTQCFGGEL